ncbi:MAG: hypothetical protein JRG83_06160 [Deltaproteobacteria bacterium]|nr:hypothetical protein [Deltaproteobacteria bacterium]
MNDVRTLRVGPGTPSGLLLATDSMSPAAIRERIAAQRDASASPVQILPYNAKPEGRAAVEDDRGVGPGSD